MHAGGWLAAHQVEERLPGAGIVAHLAQQAAREAVDHAANSSKVRARQSFGSVS